MKDPIVAEVRKTRQKHAKKFAFDMKAICGDLRRIQENCGHRVVTLAPKVLPKMKSETTS